MAAAFIDRKTEWCWGEWVTWEHTEKQWAIAELKKWVKDGDHAPDILGIQVILGILAAYTAPQAT